MSILGGMFMYNTSFETIGINHQYDATTPEIASKRFAYSCDCCCKKGRNVPCDKCGIAVAHALVMAIFNDNNDRKEH